MEPVTRLIMIRFATPNGSRISISDLGEHCTDQAKQGKMIITWANLI